MATPICTLQNLEGLKHFHHKTAMTCRASNPATGKCTLRGCCRSLYGKVVPSHASPSWIVMGSWVFLQQYQQRHWQYCKEHIHPNTPSWKKHMDANCEAWSQGQQPGKDQMMYMDSLHTGNVVDGKQDCMHDAQRWWWHRCQKAILKNGPLSVLNKNIMRLSARSRPAWIRSFEGQGMPPSTPPLGLACWR